jgi:ubiquinone/menaquinone biosynthesis C-methylase UbiE
LAENLARLDRLLARCPFPAGARVLELGCGAGDLSLRLAERGLDATGVDVSPAAVEWARQKAASRGLAAAFRVRDVPDLRDFADSGFDGVLDGYCLHCVIGPDRAKVLAAARRVLRPGGLLHV